MTYLCGEKLEKTSKSTQSRCNTAYENQIIESIISQSHNFSTILSTLRLIIIETSSIEYGKISKIFYRSIIHEWKNLLIGQQIVHKNWTDLFNSNVCNFKDYTLQKKSKSAN